MKNVLILLCFVLLLASCKKNTPAPADIPEGEQMLGEYLYGAFAMRMKSVKFQDGLFSETIPN